MTDNSAIVKIITKHTEEYNKLSDKYKTLMEVHKKTLRNEYNLTDKIKEQRREIVEDLNYWLEIIDRDRKEGNPQYDNEYIVGDLKSKWEGKK